MNIAIPSQQTMRRFHGALLVMVKDRLTVEQFDNLHTTRQLAAALVHGAISFHLDALYMAATDRLI